MGTTFNEHVQLASTKRSPDTNGSAEQEEWSDEASDQDDDGADEVGSRKRRKPNSQRPLSVSCEKCKERKVKCDRGQPNCGWCLRNNKVCEYKERKKPGLRAGYGRELEARLGQYSNNRTARYVIIGSLYACKDKQQEIIQRHEAAIAQLMNTIHGNQSSPHSEIFGASSHPIPHIPRPETAL